MFYICFLFQNAFIYDFLLNASTKTKLSYLLTYDFTCMPLIETTMERVIYYEAHQKRHVEMKTTQHCVLLKLLYKCWITLTLSKRNFMQTDFMRKYFLWIDNERGLECIRTELRDIQKGGGGDSLLWYRLIMAIICYNGKFVTTAKSLETNVAIVTRADSMLFYEFLS